MSRMTRLGATAALLAFSACSPASVDYPSPEDTTETSSTNVPPADSPAYSGPATDIPSEPAAFENVEWRLARSGDSAAPQAASDSVAITARFESATGTVGGSGGCNSYTADYARAGPSLEVGDARATLMACDDAVTEAEVAYLTSLSAVVAWEMAAGELTLSTADGTILVFTPAEESQ
jgi:heat shock protein HslJ